MPILFIDVGPKKEVMLCIKKEEPNSVVGWVAPGILFFGG